MVRWWLAAIAAVVGMAGEARASETSPVPLKWRSSRAAPGETRRVSQVPNARVNWVQSAKGRYVSVVYDDGTMCSAVALPSEAGVTFTCGTTDAHYQVSEGAGHEPVLEWVTFEAGHAVGDK